MIERDVRMSSIRRFIAAAGVAIAAFALAAGTMPQAAHADTVHAAVNSGYADSAGNAIYYKENKNNAYSSGTGHADVTVFGFYETLGVPDGVNDIFGAEIYAYHYGPGKCNCWSLDASQAAGIGATANADETNQPCEWVLWYVWDFTSHSPVLGGNFC
jgi:hypothetical protein